jgi:hypothetical protein
MERPFLTCSLASDHRYAFDGRELKRLQLLLAWNWVEQQLPSGEAISDVDRMTLLPMGKGVPWLGQRRGRRGNTWSRRTYIEP